MLPPLLRPTAADCCVCALPPAPEADADALVVELEYEDEDFLLEESVGSESSRSSGDCNAPPVLLLELLELRVAGDEVAAASSLRERLPERELRSRRKFASESAPFRSLQGNISRQKAVIIISLSAKYTYSNGSNGI